MQLFGTRVSHIFVGLFCFVVHKQLYLEDTRVG